MASDPASTCAPIAASAYSLIGDYFSPRRLGLAVGIYSMGAYIGTGLALLLGGAVLTALPESGITVPLLGEVKPWRAVFLLLLPIGLVVALWVATLREPPRRLTGASDTADWSAARLYFSGHWRMILGIDCTVGFANMAGHGLLAWAPALMGRAYGMRPEEAGWPLGLIVIFACSTGTLLAGAAGDALRSRGWSRGRLIVMAVALACAIPWAALAPVAATGAGFLAMVAPLLFCLAAALGSGPATLQEITPNRVRGLQHAIAVLIANLLGLGIGPTAIALLTDYWFADSAAVGLSMSLALPFMLTVALAACLAALRVYKPHVQPA